MYKSSGMKRDRVNTLSPPSSMSKRSRSSTGGMGRYAEGNNESSDDGSPPERSSRSQISVGDRQQHHQPRVGGSQQGSRSRNLSPRARNYNNDEYPGRGNYKEGSRHGGHHSTSSGGGGGSHYQYKVLCISNLHSKASDEVIRDTLYREFKKFGEISVKVVHEPDERLAFVYFRSAEDAREAKHSKPIILFDRRVTIEAAYESTSTPVASYNNSASSRHHSPPQNKARYTGGNDYESGKMYRRSPVYDNLRGGREEHNRYDSRPYHDRSSMAPPPGPPPPMHYNNREGGYRGGRDIHNDGGYNPRGPPGGGGPPMHYSRYPPGPPGGLRHHHNSMAPPPHHHPGMEAPAAPPGMGGGPPGIGGGPPGAPRYENKKDKFPNYLHHVLPEDDPLATRTLFAGNLEVNITDEELRRIFGRYGTVEDIDIKRPPPGTGNAYAFVRYVNLDMAARAKAELSGQYIGKFQCKIGYGKVNATTKIWIGGLGPWTTMAMMEREFDRFGSIKKIDWVKGEMYAYITYETIDAAQAAVKDMRGYPLGGNDKRLRTDFADAGAPLIAPIPGVTPGPTYGKRDYPYEGEPGGNAGDFEFNNRGPGYRGQQQQGGGGRGFSRNSREDLREGAEVPTGRSGGPGSTHSGGTDLGTSPDRSDSESAAGGDRPRNGVGLLNAAKSIQDISKRPVGWQGSLILKNSSFPSKLYMTEGDLEGVDVLMKDEDGKSQLRITQRLRLDQSKLDDVVKRIQGSTAHGVFLALPGSGTINPVASPSDAGDGGSVQSRPLRNLVSYLKQKEAAGVISLVNPKDPSVTGVLYVFPPCTFSWDLLKKNCTSLVVDESSESVAKEDHLVIVVIRGGTA